MREYDKNLNALSNITESHGNSTKPNLNVSIWPQTDQSYKET